MLRRGYSVGKTCQTIHKETSRHLEREERSSNGNDGNTDARRRERAGTTGRERSTGVGRSSRRSRAGSRRGGRASSSGTVGDGGREATGRTLR